MNTFSKFRPHLGLPCSHFFQNRKTSGSAVLRWWYQRGGGMAGRSTPPPPPPHPQAGCCCTNPLHPCVCWHCPRRHPPHPPHWRYRGVRDVHWQCKAASEAARRLRGAACTRASAASSRRYQTRDQPAIVHIMLTLIAAPRPVPLWVGLPDQSRPPHEEECTSSYFMFTGLAEQRRLGHCH